MTIVLCVEWIISHSTVNVMYHSCNTQLHPHTHLSTA